MPFFSFSKGSIFSFYSTCKLHPDHREHSELLCSEFDFLAIFKTVNLNFCNFYVVNLIFWPFLCSEFDVLAIFNAVYLNFCNFHVMNLIFCNFYALNLIFWLLFNTVNLIFCNFYAVNLIFWQFLMQLIWLEIIFTVDNFVTTCFRRDTKIQEKIHCALRRQTLSKLSEFLRLDIWEAHTALWMLSPEKNNKKGLINISYLNKCPPFTSGCNPV